MTTDMTGLAALGWSNFFQAQLAVGGAEGLMPARVLAVHRNALEVASPGFSGRILPLVDEDPEKEATVGDWLLIEGPGHAPRRILERKSVFKRRAAGTGRRVQLIAANVDTLLIVTSCNQDFNVARLERYLALAREAAVTPVIVITKADLAEDPSPYVRAAQKLMPGLLVECLDARDPTSAAVLAPWCAVGQTVALVGSSGVGKSTLVNTLTGVEALATAAIREDDGRGRHTTTGRSMHRLASGGWLLDTPGMRELQLADVGEGIEDVFADIVAIAARCRFHDCRHHGEPGCAVEAAVADGTLEPERVARFAKLMAEDARNSEALHERHARERVFGRMVRGINKEKRARWNP
ncbi:MAG: ribosome small subunit-dependent GTPase A [Bauldia sp.]|nr:ribosome small subunit-dependent GTPase A [Bauldia sp.]